MSGEKEFEVSRPKKYLECFTCPIADKQIEEASKENIKPYNLVDISVECNDFGHKIVRDKNEQALVGPNTAMEIKIRGTLYYNDPEDDYIATVFNQFVDCPHYFPSEK